MSRVVAFLGLAACTACSVLVDTSGLSGGSADLGASEGGTLGDAASDATSDATSDAASPPLFSDLFARPADPGPIAPWSSPIGAWTVTGGTMRVTSLATFPTGAGAVAAVDASWSDYTVTAEIALPSGCYGGGVGGRANFKTGAHYALWVYPAGSPAPAGAMAMSLVKTSDWVNWSGTPMKHAPLTVVGTAKHVLTLTFRGSTITTTYDGIALQVTDDGTYAPSAANTSGGITLETWSANAATAMTVSKVVVTPL